MPVSPLLIPRLYGIKAQRPLVAVLLKAHQSQGVLHNEARNLPRHLRGALIQPWEGPLWRCNSQEPAHETSNSLTR